MGEPTGIDEALTAYADDDYSVRLVRAVCTVVPFAPDLPSTYSLVDIIKDLDPKAERDVFDMALDNTRLEPAEKALWMIKAMDTADTGIGVYSGLSSAVKLYRAEEGQRLDALETDPQQAADAVLKALAMAYIVMKLFRGDPLEKVNAFRNTKAGQAMLFYFCAIEVGVPFADNALLGGGKLMQTLYQQFGPDQTDKLAAITGDEEAQQANTMLHYMIGPMGKMVKAASGHLNPIATAAATHLPTAINAGDKAAGAVATAADMLPVYKFLGTRLVAEVCARRAIEVVAAEKIATETDNPALVGIKYTTGDDSKKLPDAPEAKKRSCLPFFVALLALAGGSGGAFIALVLTLL